MPRTDIIVRLDDGKDHRIVDGETTGCGQAVPPLTPWEAEAEKPCPTCFPESKAKGKKAA